MGHAATARSSDRLSSEDYRRIAKTIEIVAGIRFPLGKKVVFESRLRTRMRAVGISCFAEYCLHLHSPAFYENELEQLLNVVSTNTTEFYREPGHFQFLVEKGLPEMLENRRSEALRPRLKVWSAASSNGAEAFTLAMILHEQMSIRQNFDFAVLGTDISTAILEEAEQAIYPVRMLRPIPKTALKHYIMKSSSSRTVGEFRISPLIRRHVRFARLNLMDEFYAVDTNLDVIFLRNVLIYFSTEDQEAVVARLVRHLRPGGYLFLGHCETGVGNRLKLRQVSAAVFQRE